MKVDDPAHSYQSPVNLIVRQYSSDDLLTATLLPSHVLDATTQLTRNTAFFRCTFTIATRYEIEVSIPGLPPNSLAPSGAWSNIAARFRVEHLAPGPIDVTESTFNTGGPLSGEFVPFRMDKFGNSVPIKWSNDDVETFVAEKPSGTPLQILPLRTAEDDPMVRRRNGDLYGIHLGYGFGLTFLAPSNAPSRLDIKIVITGTHHFRGWVEWFPIPA
ncbi:MAG TPA: hypothetical protein VIM11_14590 [Tepidisphaeraceae bacterium]